MCTPVNLLSRKKIESYCKTNREIDPKYWYSQSCNFLKLLHIDDLQHDQTVYRSVKNEIRILTTSHKIGNKLEILE